MQNHDVVERQTQSVSQDVLKLSREVQSLQNKMFKLETAQGKIQREINDLKFQVLPSEPNIEILVNKINSFLSHFLLVFHVIFLLNCIIKNNILHFVISHYTIFTGRRDEGNIQNH